MIAAAVAACSAQGGGTVRLAEGVFRLGASDVEQAWNVSGFGGTLWYIVIDGANDVKLLGSVDSNGAVGTKIVVTGLINFIRVSDTTNFVLGNIVLDMDRPNWSYGQLIPGSCVEDGCDFTINGTEYPFDAFHSPVPQSLLEVPSMYSFDPDTWRMGPDNDTVELYTTGAKIASVRSSSADGDNDMLVASVRNVEQAWQVQRLNASQGYHFILRHRTGHQQISGQNNTHLLQENITCYLASSMFDVISDSDLTLRKVHLKRHDGTTGSWSSSAGIRRPKSAYADCFGTPSARGSVLVEDCLCDGQGDDGFNGGFNYNQILSVSDDRKSAHLSWSTDTADPPVAYSVRGFVAGDRVEVFNRSSFAKLFSTKITTLQNHSTVAVFDEALPPTVGRFDLVGPATDRLYSLTIRRSTFQSNRGRGLLLFTSNIVVEDVVIDSPSMECVMAEPDGCHWLEGSVASNVTMRNVSLRGCAHSHYGPSPGPVEHSTSIFLGECVPRWQGGVPTTGGTPVLGGTKVFHNWTVEGCQFEPPAGRTAVHAISLSGMTFRSNMIKGGAAQPFVFVGSDSCMFSGNRCRAGGQEGCASVSDNCVVNPS